MTTTSLLKEMGIGGVSARLLRKFTVKGIRRHRTGTYEERKARVSESEWRDVDNVFGFAHDICQSWHVAWLAVLALAIKHNWVREIDEMSVIVDIPCQRKKYVFEFGDTWFRGAIQRAKKAASEK